MTRVENQVKQLAKKYSHSYSKRSKWLPLPTFLPNIIKIVLGSNNFDKSDSENKKGVKFFGTKSEYTTSYL